MYICQHAYLWLMCGDHINSKKIRGHGPEFMQIIHLIDGRSRHWYDLPMIVGIRGSNFDKVDLYS